MHLKAQLVVANNQVESLTQMNSEQEQRIEQLKTLNTSLQVRSRDTFSGCDCLVPCILTSACIGREASRGMQAEPAHTTACKPRQSRLSCCCSCQHADRAACHPALQHDKTGLQQELLHQATDHERERNKLSQQNQELSAKLTALTQESEATRFAYEEQVRCAAADSLWHQLCLGLPRSRPASWLRQALITCTPARHAARLPAAFLHA